LNLIKLSESRVKIEILRDKFTFVLTFLVQLRYRIAAELRFCGATRGAGILLVVYILLEYWRAEEGATAVVPPTA